MINLPASKSIGARFLVASCFANTLADSPVFDDCDDLRVIQGALRILAGLDRPSAPQTPAIDVHASGTAFRFVTAAVASTPGADFIVTGTPRLCSRPMDPLLDVLRKAGADITPLGEAGRGPYHVRGGHLKGGDFEIRGDVSSQFISALMLAAPTWEGGMNLHFTTELVSRPYAGMTAHVMERFGIEVVLSDDGVRVGEGSYVAPADFKVEADWSAAGFFYEAAAMKLSPVGIAGLTSPGESLQGDAATAEFFRPLGVMSTFRPDGVEAWRREELPDALEADLTHNPDLAPAFALACGMNACRFRFTGVRNLRLKECDRLEAIRKEMGKLGFPIKVGDDFIAWEGGKYGTQKDPVIDTYDDHRIAMSFAIAALRKGRILISHPEVVDKSFSGFWDELPKLGLRCDRESDVMVVTDERWEFDQKMRFGKKI